MNAPRPATPPPSATTPLAGKMVSLKLESKPTIYASYMSFPEFGGVFLPTDEKFSLGAEVLLVLELVTNVKTEKLFIKTKVCWLNQNPSSGGRPRGVGLAFGSDENGIKAKEIIESLLTGLLANERPTYTL